MGCDIHGAVEFRWRNDTSWWRAIDAGTVLDRNYDEFGYLWGVRNYVNFKPLFANRGIPKTLSTKTKDEIERWDSDAHSHTWASYEELSQVSWKAEAVELDERVHIFDSEGKNIGKASYTWEMKDLTEEESGKLARGERVQTKQGGYLQFEREKASEIGHKDFDTLMAMMKPLAKEYGGKNVRLIVWFDN